MKYLQVYIHDEQISLWWSHCVMFLNPDIVGKDVYFLPPPRSQDSRQLCIIVRRSFSLSDSRSSAELMLLEKPRGSARAWGDIKNHAVEIDEFSQKLPRVRRSLELFHDKYFISPPRLALLTTTTATTAPGVASTQKQPLPPPTEVWKCWLCIFWILKRLRWKGSVTVLVFHSGEPTRERRWHPASIQIVWLVEFT